MRREEREKRKNEGGEEMRGRDFSYRCLAACCVTQPFAIFFFPSFYFLPFFFTFVIALLPLSVVVL